MGGGDKKSSRNRGLSLTGREGSFTHSAENYVRFQGGSDEARGNWGGKK